MDEILKQLLDQIRGSWRFRWWALGVAWVFAGAGWMAVYAMPNQYAAETRVFVDTDNALRPLLRGLAFQSNVMSKLNMMTRVMLSRPILEKVARETDLHLRAGTPEEMESMIERMREEIEISGGVRDNIFTISYTDPDRNMAENIVRKLLDTFVTDTLSAARTDTSSAQEFLEVQIADHERRLQEAETRLADFKKRNLGMMPGQGGDLYARLQREIEEASVMRSELVVAMNTRDALNRQLLGTPTANASESVGVDEPTSIPAIDAKIAQHQDSLDQLLLRYTRKHPDVEMLEGMIEQLNEKKAQMISSLEESGVQGLGGDNPIYQSIRIALSEAEVQVSTLNSRLAQQQRLIAELRGRLDTIPEIEAEMTSLNRDYESVRKRYLELQSRLESSKLSELAEESADDVQFRIIDPPSAGLDPVAPNRPLFLSGVFILALVAGGALAFLLNLLRPVFFDVSQLRQIIGRPVLGSISTVRTAMQLKRRNMQLASWVVGFFSLTLVYTAILAFQERGVRLVQLILDRGLL